MLLRVAGVSLRVPCTIEIINRFLISICARIHNVLVFVLLGAVFVSMSVLTGLWWLALGHLRILVVVPPAKPLVEGVVGLKHLEVIAAELIHDDDVAVREVGYLLADDEGYYLLRHLGFLSLAQRLVGPNVKVVPGDPVIWIVLMLTLFPASLRIVDQVIVAVPDVHTRLAGVQRLLPRAPTGG